MVGEVYLFSLVVALMLTLPVRGIHKIMRWTDIYEIAALLEDEHPEMDNVN